MEGNLSDANNFHKKFFDDLITLNFYGGNSVMRRVVRRTLNYFQDLGIDTAEIAPDREIDPCRRCCNNVLTTRDVIDEGRADSGRQNILLNPQEALTAGLFDFFTGRSEVLEVRHSMSDEEYRETEKRSVKFVSEQIPKVEVRVLDANLESTVVALRSMADRIERLGKAGTLLAIPPVIESDDGVTILDSCSFWRTLFLGDRWIDNGKTLQKHFVDEYSCTSNDSCCSNRNYTKRQNDRWETVWQDNGTPTNRPPQMPPNYSPLPWAGQLNLFPTPVVGNVFSDFGWRTINGQLDFHAGIDVVVGAGTGVLSLSGGRVVRVSHGPDPATTGIIVKDGDLTRTYWHVRAGTGVIEGQQVRPGQTIGSVVEWGGRTHLHYAEHLPPNGDWTQRQDANARDPVP